MGRRPHRRPRRRPLTIDRLVAEIDRSDPRRTGELAGGSDPYGPILLAEL